MNLNMILGVLVHFLIFILLIIFFINNRKNKTNLIFILCATIIYICYLLEFVRRPNIMKLNVENFKAPLDYSMGPYTNLKLNSDMKVDNTDYTAPAQSNGDCKWRKKPCDVPLLSKVNYVGPTGQVGRYVEDPTYNPYMPSVDGKNKCKRSMFMFTHNQVSPDCCPSTYTTDNGCVCTTKQQRDFINKRGHNRSSGEF